VGRPGHMAIVEAWKDQAAADAHATSPATTAFRAALQPIRVSGYDERPYKALAVGPIGQLRPAPNTRVVHVLSHVDVGNPANAAALLIRLAEASRAEAGCLRFDVLQHTMRANHFTVIESWTDQRAYDAHVASAHTKQYRDDLQPMTGSPLDERVYLWLE
jgi:quinol monooxygenase YgiN